MQNIKIIIGHIIAHINRNINKETPGYRRKLKEAILMPTWRGKELMTQPKRLDTGAS